jgi:hypothetical protein
VSTGARSMSKGRRRCEPLSTAILPVPRSGWHALWQDPCDRPLSSACRLPPRSESGGCRRWARGPDPSPVEIHHHPAWDTHLICAARPVSSSAVRGRRGVMRALPSSGRGATPTTEKSHADRFPLAIEPGSPAACPAWHRPCSLPPCGWPCAPIPMSLKPIAPPRPTHQRDPRTHRQDWESGHPAPWDCGN